jgi:hypothetical protein
MYFIQTVNRLNIFTIRPVPKPNPTIAAESGKPNPRPKEINKIKPPRLFPFTKAELKISGKTGLQQELLITEIPPTERPNRKAVNIPAGFSERYPENEKCSEIRSRVTRPKKINKADKKSFQTMGGKADNKDPVNPAIVPAKAMIDEVPSKKDIPEIHINELRFPIPNDTE